MSVIFQLDKKKSFVALSPVKSDMNRSSPTSRNGTASPSNSRRKSVSAFSPSKSTVQGKNSPAPLSASNQKKELSPKSGRTTPLGSKAKSFKVPLFALDISQLLPVWLVGAALGLNRIHHPYILQVLSRAAAGTSLKPGSTSASFRLSKRTKSP